MIAIYIFCLGVSGAVFGAFVRQVLGELQYVLGFQMALTVATGAAFIYGAVELLYMTVVRALKPTSSPGPLVSESLSFLAIFILTPYLLDVSIQWPHPILEKLEPLIYLAAFGAVHVFFKLSTFYAAVRGEAGGRLATGGWLLGATASALVGYWCVSQWMVMADEARPKAVAAAQYYRVGAQYATAREVPEGATVLVDLQGDDRAGLTLRWAPGPSEEHLDRIYVNTRMIGDESEDRSWPVSLQPGGWAELNVPASAIPSNLQKCEVMWERNRRPTWQRLLGLQPLVASSGKALLSGPFLHEEGAPGDRPNVLMIVVEGLGSGHVSGFGYPRKTTPSLDALIKRSTAYKNAYVPTPDTAGACMTLLTGVSPILHGHLGKQAGPLPEMFDTLAETLAHNMYTTAAFTEGEREGTGDLIPGTGFERGFEIFDPTYPTAALESDNYGSKETLDKAAKWIQEHGTQRFFVFVRLRELADPVWRTQYAPGFVPKDAPPSEVDVYDSALAYLDKRIGGLIGKLKSTEAGKNTCIIVTSSYGIDFTGPNGPVIGLTEESLRVPLIVGAPTVEQPMLLPLRVGLEDVAPTVLALAQTGLDYKIDGVDLGTLKEDRGPISVFGVPPVLSTRLDRWRFYWSQETGAVEAKDVEPAAKKSRQSDEANKKALADQCLIRFKNYISSKS